MGFIVKLKGGAGRNPAPPLVSYVLLDSYTKCFKAGGADALEARDPVLVHTGNHGAVEQREEGCVLRD